MNLVSKGELYAMNIKMFFPILIGVMILTSCNQKQNNTQPNRDLTSIEQTNYLQNDTIMNNNDIASHLANVALGVPNVNDAAAIVAGPYAVVGIDINAETERQHVGTIKYSVSEALQHDRYGRTAVVVADADVLQRIRDMRDKTAQGHPIQGTVDELAEIVSRYMPTFPVNEHQPKEQDPHNEQNLDEEQQKNLDDIQQNQSNNK